MEENLAGIYKEKLDKEANKGAILASFYWSAMDLEYNPKDIIMFNKLLKMYGRDAVFISILEIYDMPDVDLTNIYGLLAFFCKKYFSSRNKPNEFIDINKLSKSIEKAKSRRKTFIKEFKNEFESRE